MHKLYRSRVSFYVIRSNKVESRITKSNTEYVVVLKGLSSYQASKLANILEPRPENKVLAIVPIVSIQQKMSSKPVCDGDRPTQACFHFIEENISSCCSRSEGCMTSDTF